jgi:Xaa-Pro aminopeptidase
VEKAAGHQESEPRRDKLHRALDKHGIEDILIYSSMLRRENLRYFTNFNSMEPGAAAFFSPHSPPLLMVPTNEEKVRAQSESWIRRVESYGGDVQNISRLLKTIRMNKKVGIAGWDYFPLNLMLELRRSLPDKEWSDVTPAVHDIRINKTEGEIQKIEKAAGIADAAYENLLLSLKPGMREYEIIAGVESFIRKSQGGDNFQILASGAGDARAMHPPTDRALREGDLVITEISPQVDGYFAQICRSMVIGPASDARRKAYDILFRAQQNGLDQVRPGMTASELAKIQNDVFRQEGFGEYVSEEYTRGRGHGIGLYIDEEPLIAEGNDFGLNAGMVIMIHPNTYLPLSGYMVLGDPVLITEKGGRRLSRSRRDLATISAHPRGLG